MLYINKLPKCIIITSYRTVFLINFHNSLMCCNDLQGSLRITHKKLITGVNFTQFNGHSLLQSCSEAGKEKETSPTNSARYAFVSDKVLRDRENKSTTCTSMSTENCRQGTEPWSGEGEITDIQKSDMDASEYKRQSNMTQRV